MTDSDDLAKKLVQDAETPEKKIVDLAELGSPGYAPKGDMTFAALRADLERHDIAWDAFTGSGYFAQRTAEFSAVMEQAKSAEMAATIAANTTAKPVPHTTVSTTVVKDESQAVMLVPEKPSRGQGFDIALLAAPKPPIKSGFTSAVKIESSTRLFFHRMSCPALSFVPSSDPKFAPVSFMKWLHMVIGMYGGLYIGIQNDYEPTDRVVKTKDSQAGFDMRGYYMKQVHSEMQGKLLEGFRSHRAPEGKIEPFLYARFVDFYGLKAEADLIQHLTGLEARHLYDVRDWHNFHRLWDSETLALRSIDERIIFQKTRIFANHTFGNYRTLMDSDPAFVGLMCGLVRQNIDASMRIGRQEDRAALTEVFRVVKFDRNTVSFANNIADEIMRADGPGVLRDVSLLMQMARWACGEIDVTMAIASVPVIVGLCMIKLITPKYIWSARARIMIDNTLARWLLRSLPDFKSDVAGITQQDFEYEENQLERMLTTPAWWSNAADLASLRDFLLHWSDRDSGAFFGLYNVNLETVNVTTRNEHGAVRFFPHDYVSMSATDKLYMSKDGPMPFTQLMAFEKFAMVIDRMASQPRRWRLLKNELIAPLQRTLTEIASRSEMIRELMFRFNLAHRFLSLHTLTGPSKEGLLPNRYVTTSFDPAAFANIVFTVNPDTVMNVRYDATFYYKTLSIHELLSDVGDGLAIAKRYLKAPLWKASERIEEAMKLVKDHPLKKWLQDELIVRKKVIPFERLTPSVYLSAKLEAAATFFQQLTPGLLGYTTSFVYTNGFENGMVSMEPTQRYRVLLVSRKMSGLTTLTLKDLEKLVLRGELAAFLKKANGPVRFNIPAKLTAGPPSVTSVIPFDLSGDTKIEVSQIVVGFRDGDDEVRHFSDEFANLMPRAYLSETVPWVEVDHDYPLQKLVHTMVVWSELDFGVPLEYMKVRPN